MKSAVLVLGGVLLATLLGPVAGLLISLVLTIGAGVLGNDVDRNAAAIGVKVVTIAALLVPRSERAECVAEWSDDVLCASEDGQGVRPLLKALGIAVIGAPLLAVLVRYDPRRRRARG